MNKKNNHTTASFDLSAYLDQKRRIVNHWLESLLENHCTSSRLYQAMHYSLMNPGKRLRPVLCMAAAEAAGSGQNPLVMRTACAIEMIHTYSLIHDDLPAMDDDELRRGRPTCHVKFDEATAIMAGDALLTLAFEILSNKEVSPGSFVDSGDSDDAETVPVSRRLDIIQRIAKAAGNKGMIEGQMQDMFAHSDKMDLSSLKTIHDMKTGKMFEASVICGAIAGGADSISVDALGAYARSIGLAFQVTDDILNVEGDAGVMGKSTGTDILHGKATYPALLGLDASKQYAEKLVATALQSLAVFDNKAMPLFAIATYIIERKR